MIRSKNDYRYFLKADRIALARAEHPSMGQRIKRLLAPDHIWKFQKMLRKLEYYTNCKHGALSKMYKAYLALRHRNMSLRLGFSIPPNVFGPGLSIAHHGTIVINSGTRVGANCRLHACVNIGTEAGFANKAPTIGDNCYIGPGAKMYGKIEIADGTAIGANAVVTRSFTEPHCAIAGVPAKVIAKVDTLDLLIPATRIIELGLENTDKLAGLSARDVKAILQEREQAKP